MPIVLWYTFPILFSLLSGSKPRGTQNIIISLYIYPPKQGKSKYLCTQQKELNEMKNRKRKQPQTAMMMMMRGCLILNGNRKCS